MNSTMPDGSGILSSFQTTTQRCNFYKKASFIFSSSNPRPPLYYNNVPYMLAMSPLQKSLALEVVPGNLLPALDSPNHIIGEFSIKENGSGVLFGGTITDPDFVLPPFKSSRPNAKVYYESGKQPKEDSTFKLYIDSQGVRIVVEDGVLITAVFDEPIVLDAEGYEVHGTVFWIGKETGPD